MSASSADRTVSNPPAGFPRTLPHLIYDDVDAALDWLTEVFGFRERVAARHTEADGKAGRAQMEVLDSLVTIGRPSVPGDSPRGGVSSMLYVNDVDGHHEHAEASGATIITQPHIHAGDRPPTSRATSGLSRSTFRRPRPARATRRVESQPLAGRSSHPDPEERPRRF